jgi:[acyl-carrier-protein] S-malonyltransferase
LSASAFVFPGQGSQSLGMLAELAMAYPLVKTLFEEVSDHLGYDVWRLTQEGPLDVLNQTAHTQVAMLTADVAVFRVLEQRMALSKTAVLAGHSLGEYAALVCAGALSLADAARLVQRRGQLMQETVPLGVGAMAAIVGLTDDQVLEICQAVSTELSFVSPANYNAVGQVVIAGHTAAVHDAIQQAEQKDARMAVLIPVSVPCHCLLLKPAADEFTQTLQSTAFQTPHRVVMSTVNLMPYDAPASMRSVLAEQLYRPVQWVLTIQAMKKQGTALVIECGPGKVLAGLIKRIDKSIAAFSVNDSQSLERAEAELVLLGEGVKCG